MNEIYFFGLCFSYIAAKVGCNLTNDPNKILQTTEIELERKENEEYTEDKDALENKIIPKHLVILYIKESTDQ